MTSPIYIGIDDTDILTSPGTGRLTREIGTVLAARYPVYGVTRHQLLQDPRVPMTAKNSANVIHISAAGEAVDLETLADEAAALLKARFQPGSDPGLCVITQPPAAVSEFGQRCKTRLVTQTQARRLAQRHKLILRPLGGDGDGIIGALAAVGLAHTGNDGRFTWVGRVRELAGRQPIEAILAAGVHAVRTVAGEPLESGLVETHNKLRPALLGGKPVLLVESVEGVWQPVRRD